MAIDLGKTDLNKIGKVLKTCRLAAPIYGHSWLSILLRVARLRLRERFSPKEAFLWGLANPAMASRDIADYTSRSQLYRLQARHNPKSLAFLTEDKAFFYGYCQGVGIAVPRLFGVFQPQGGYSTRGPLLRERADWHRFFFEEVPDSFVVKPSKGVYARGLKVLSREGSSLIDQDGRHFSVDQLLDHLSADKSYDTWVIQERVVNHPQLAALSGSRSVQTARTVTFVGQDRQPRVLFACFKVVASDHASDNFDYGESGNLLGNVDIETGKLEKVVGKAKSGVGLDPHTHHPRTGLPFDEVVLPHWPALLRLAEEAALKFWPLRTIGWDIAIGPDGPIILEGNVWWDALHNTHRLMPRYQHLT